MIANASHMYRALYHPYSNPEKSQQMHEDHVTESDNTRGSFESNGMDKELK